MDSLPSIIDTGVKVAVSIVDGIVSALPKISAAALHLINSLIEGIIKVIPTVAPAAVKLADTLIKGILSVLPKIADAALKLVTALAEGIAEALPSLIPAAIQTVIEIVNTIINNLPMILDAALAIITGLIQGILTALPLLIEALPAIVNGIVGFLTEAIPQIIEAGKQLLLNIIGALPEIIEGIVSAANTFKAPLQDGEFFVNSAVNMRNITLQGQIFPWGGAAGGKVFKDTVNLDRIYELRHEIITVFKPKSNGTLEFREKKIECFVEEVYVSYETNERFPAFMISLLCPYPFWSDAEEFIKLFNSWINRFSFPLSIPQPGTDEKGENYGIEFAARRILQIQQIGNFGDIPCGMTVIFNSSFFN